MSTSRILTTVVCTAVLSIVTLNPVRATLVVVEPDDFAVGADLTAAVEGVILSVEAQPDANVTAEIGSSGACGPDPTVAAPCTSTGVKVFGGANITGDPWQQNSAEFRADFLQSTDFVSIDLVGIDDGDAQLRAFASDGALLEAFVTSLSGPGHNVTASISRGTADIAYILAGGVIGEGNNLDRLIFNRTAIPEPHSAPWLAIFAIWLVANGWRKCCKPHTSAVI